MEESDMNRGEWCAKISHLASHGILQASWSSNMVPLVWFVQARI